MKAIHRRCIEFVCAASLMSHLVQCGSNPSPTEPLGRASSPVTAEPDDAETAKIQAFLDSRYTASDVKHSFQTKAGQTIDCIDFFAQPGVKSRAARGRPITQIPTFSHHDVPGAGPGYDAFDGQPDENGSSRKCPDGTVAQVHLSADRIKSIGGLDALRHHVRHAAPPVNLYALPPGCPGAGFTTCQGQPDWTDYAHVISAWTGTNTSNVGDIMSINQPAVPQTSGIDDHSLTQLWVLSGTGFADFGCSCINGGTGSPQCTQSVETGITVDNVLNSSNPNPSAPAIFTFATNDGYALENQDEDIPPSCYNDNLDGDPTCAVTFVAATNSSYAVGMALTTGVLGSYSDELGFSVINENGEWVINVGGSTIGFYIASDYNGSMQTEATTFELGNEIFDSTDACIVPMGSGANPWVGATQSAFHTNYYAYPEGSGTQSTSFATPQASVPSIYTWSTSPASPGGAAGNFFYVGNASQSFGPSAGNTDFGSAWWPNGTNWDNGSYTADCGLLNGQGIPLSGVSEAAGGTSQAHAIRCWDPPYGSAETSTMSVTTTASSCYLRSLGSDDDRGYSGSLDPGTNGDWDPGYYKDECRENEYVNGIALSTSGQVDGILCCPGAMMHASCNVQVFDNGNSSQFSLPDWDYGFYKGQCPSGAEARAQYVAGISTPAFGQQAAGTPHAILCCE
jgi:hypothetical protein